MMESLKIPRVMIFPKSRCNYNENLCTLSVIGLAVLLVYDIELLHDGYVAPPRQAKTGEGPPPVVAACLPSLLLALLA